MLRIGKLKESALKRSVLKNINNNKKDIICKAGIGTDAAVIDFEDKESKLMAVSSDPFMLPCKNASYYAIIRSLNNLAAQRAKAVGIELTVLLPEETEESDLKEIMRLAGKTADAFGVQIAGGHTEVSKAVNNPVINVSSFGLTGRSGRTESKAVPGDDIILTKWIGLEGTSIIACERKSELDKVFPKAFVERAVNFRNYLSVAEEGNIADEFGVSCMHDVSTGGIFGALWEMAEGSKVGLDVDLKMIPVRQETIEICEVYGLNPYEMLSGGSMLIACKRGSELVSKLEEADIPAFIIGKATDSSARIIHNDEEIRYLDIPKADEILKMF